MMDRFPPSRSIEPDNIDGFLIPRSELKKNVIGINTQAVAASLSGPLAAVVITLCICSAVLA